MKNFKKAILLVCALGLHACGSDKDNSKDEPKKQKKTSEQKKVPAEVPAATIMVVPVDKDGNEIAERAEMRTVNADISNKNTVDLLKMFDKGTKIEESQIVTDDFEESSTASWFGWFGWKKRNRGCGNYNYCDYQPQCGYQQSTYSYQTSYYGNYCNQGYGGGYGGGCGQVQDGYRVGYGYEGYPADQSGYPYESPFVGADPYYHVYGWQRATL